MEGSYRGTHGDSGYFRIGFLEISCAPAGMVFGEWRGTLFIQKPRIAKQPLNLVAKKRRSAQMLTILGTCRMA